MKNRNQKKQTYLKASKNEENKIKNNLKSISKFQNPNSKLHSGITLIALVVTVVVLLILAGVTITLMFGENNIFDLAKDAADKTNTAIEDEKTAMEGLDQYIKDNVGGTENSGGSSGGNPDVPPTSNLPEGWDSNKVTVVPGTESKPVPLPNGFVKSEIDGEQNVNTGLVIYQIPEADRTDDIWTKNETGDANILDVQEKYNQFVWVPVDNPSEMFGADSNGNSLGKLYNFTASGATPYNWQEDTANPGKIKWTSNTSYREPDVVTGSSGTSYDGASSNYTNANIKYKDTNTIITTATQFKEQLQGEFEDMRTSVETYGGFYIGRYETGNWHALDANIAKYGTTKAVVVRGNTDISGNSTSDSEATWYAMYQKSKEITNNAEIKSSMIWGCQWDRTLEWIVDTNRTVEGNKDYTIVTNSSSWGNYSGGKKATGSSNTYQANQIYDMAGNVYDWTIEANKTSNRVLRRGPL